LRSGRKRPTKGGEEDEVDRRWGERERGSRSSFGWIREGWRKSEGDGRKGRGRGRGWGCRGKRSSRLVDVVRS